MAENSDDKQSNPEKPAKKSRKGQGKGKKRAPYKRKKPTNDTKVSRMKDATVIKAILGSNQIVANVADQLGVDWTTAKKLIERNEATKRAWEEAGELMLDYGESKLLQFIEIDPVSLRFFLERKGRERGYGEKLNIDHTTKGDKMPEGTKTAITVLHLPPHLQPKKDG